MKSDDYKATYAILGFLHPLLYWALIPRVYDVWWSKSIEGGHLSLIFTSIRPKVATHNIFISFMPSGTVRNSSSRGSIMSKALSEMVSCRGGGKDQILAREAHRVDSASGAVPLNLPGFNFCDSFGMFGFQYLVLHLILTVAFIFSY